MFCQIDTNLNDVRNMFLFQGHKKEIKLIANVN